MNDRPDASAIARDNYRLTNAVARAEYLDPSIMETEIGREEVERMNRENAQGEMRLGRLMHVERELPIIKRDWQLRLAANSISWAIASFALHDCREKCESIFFATVDRIYAISQYARTVHSDDERQQIFCAAGELYEGIRRKVDEITDQSLQSLLDREPKENRPFHDFLCTVSQVLARVRIVYWQAATGEDLHHLIAKAVPACQAIELWKTGASDDSETEIPVNALYAHANAVIEMADEGIKDGRCFVKDGRVVHVNYK